MAEENWQGATWCLPFDLAPTTTCLSACSRARVLAHVAPLAPPQVVDPARYPHMASVRSAFIRGSVVRYVQLPPGSVDVELLHDATRREARGG